MALPLCAATDDGRRSNDRPMAAALRSQFPIISVTFLICASSRNESTRQVAEPYPRVKKRTSYRKRVLRLGDRDDA
jgi:hypothetical protein